MKASLIYLIIISLLSARCGDNQTDNNLSGTYVNKSESEYSKAFDTLILSKKSALNYEVVRKTGFQKVRNGSVLPKEFKSEKWPAQWDEEKMLLSETDLGRQITIDKDGGSLSLKNTKYFKIK